MGATEEGGLKWSKEYVRREGKEGSQKWQWGYGGGGEKIVTNENKGYTRTKLKGAYAFLRAQYRVYSTYI
jgi:hypothetical protein